MARVYTVLLLLVFLTIPALATKAIMASLTPAPTGVIARTDAVQALTSYGAGFNGGVLTLSVALLKQSESDDVIDPSKVVFGDYDSNNEQLCFEFLETCYWLPITPQRLAILTSLVQNEAQGIYTAWDAGKEGFVKCKIVSGECAQEIVGSELERILWDLDYARIKREPNEKQWMEELNNGLPPSDKFPQIPRAWEISDLKANITAVFSERSKSVVLSGTPHAFDRSLIVLSDNSFHGRVRVIGISRIDVGDPQNENVSNAILVLQQLALLRALKVGNNAEWMKFLKWFQ